jgi:hypothetical protein
MAIDPKKRQKKLAKQKAKRKEKAVTHRRAQGGKAASPIVSLEFELAVRAPIYECFASVDAREQGIRQVIVSRLTGKGMIAAGVFMIDTFCLGVKSAFAMFQPREKYERLLDQMGEEQGLAPIAPACARKLIEDAIAYARDLGFEPDEDYRLARKVLHDIDASSCTETFTFGKDGKPFYISGPYDSMMKSRSILATLERRCGPGGYEYLMMLEEGLSIMGDGEDEEDEDTP